MRYDEDLAYRKLILIRRLVMFIFVLALIGSIGCFVYTEVRYGSISMAMSDDRDAYRQRKAEEAKIKESVKNGSGGGITENGAKDGSSDGLSKGTELPDEKIRAEKQKKEAKEKKDKRPKKNEIGTLDLSKSLFIGNSITEGFYRWGDVKDATFYSMEGLNVNSYFNTDKFKLNNESITPDEAVAKAKGFETIFLMFGINELGWRSKEAFISRYVDVLRSIQEKQPDAKIYVQSIIYVTEKKSKADKLINNENIRKLNQKIEKMAKENGVGYIDLNAGLCDGKNYLPSEASTDGIHLGPKYCKKWRDYLITYFEKE